MNQIDENCSICFDNLQDTQISKLTCDHTFHKECINAWFSYNVIQSCPYCRRINETYSIWNNMSVDEALIFYKNKYDYNNMTRNWILDKIQLINSSIQRWNEIIIGRTYKVSSSYYEYIGIIYEKSEINSHGCFYCRIHMNNGTSNYFWSNLCNFELIN